MKIRWLFGLLVLLALLTVVLAACGDNKTGLSFKNETECGTATVTITEQNTDTITVLTVETGKKVEAELSSNVAYNYTVTYPRLEGGDQCDPQEIETILESGQMIHVTLESVPEDNTN
ncbi:MAG: hypothetical protein JXQ72_08905 [Anaerolineae bacterium]|nr:hypothetical protein [Anaerolineae bacterium]